jgi:hypothetical protein
VTGRDGKGREGRNVRFNRVRQGVHTWVGGDTTCLD